jgi:hypothetical protein
MVMRAKISWRPRAALTLLALATLGVACASVLGIEDAELDPLLGGTGGDDPTTLCDDYCSATATNCTGDFLQYTSDTVCRGVCDELPEGDLDSPVGNTVACRLNNANEAAQIGPDTECSAAGPGSDGECGDNCDSFCLLLQGLCIDVFNATYQGNIANCRSDCEANIVDLFEQNNTTFSSLLSTEGNDLQCRLYHVTQAVLDADTHCQHANGAGPCAAVGGGGSGGSGGSGGN